MRTGKLGEQAPLGASASGNSSSFPLAMELGEQRKEMRWGVRGGGEHLGITQATLVFCLTGTCKSFCGENPIYKEARVRPFSIMYKIRLHGVRVKLNTQRDCSLDSAA